MVTNLHLGEDSDKVEFEEEENMAKVVMRQDTWS